ncbi:MAG: shikimate dehydrogenase [Proteobacteria bacterium]|nr:MAG: shikimate dehydrogenase [Pseudomonadota bacterium]
MEVFAVFGKPIKHSISPRMHNLALKNLDLNGIYTRYCLKKGEDLAKTFHHLKLSGANVTIPYKEFAHNQCDKVVGIAKEIKAVNTIVKKDDKLLGYNTDAPGFILAIKDFLPLKNALILGAGGTAKAICCALKNEGLRISIVNRSKKRLEDFADLDVSLYDWNSYEPKPFDIIINTTSAGLNDELLPLPEHLLLPTIKQAKYAFDVIYHKQTPFLDACKKHHLKCKDGKEMLLYQGVLAFEIFFDNKHKQSQIAKYMSLVFDL